MNETGIEQLKDSVTHSIEAMAAFYKSKQENSPGGVKIKPREWFSIGKKSAKAAWDLWSDRDEIGEEGKDLTPDETKEVLQHGYDTWNSIVPVQNEAIDKAIKLTIEALIANWKSLAAWLAV